MEKVFCLSGSKISPVIGRYHTIHGEVEIVFLNKKYDWSGRGREEVIKCLKCKSFILPRDQKIHKMLCKQKKEILGEKEVRDENQRVD